MLQLKRIVSLFAFTIILFQVSAQETIKLRNPSFEDYPRASKQPSGWWDCGAPGESAPDVQPGFFEVKSPAYDGKTYLGIVARVTDTWEAVGQRLSTPLERGQCYKFSLQMMRSDSYMSSITGKVKKKADGSNEEEEFPFVEPLKLRIWGGNGYCDKVELLSESSLVSNTKWKEFKFVFKPKKTFKYIVLEAFYKTPTPVPYNGNLLLDNCSDIVPVDCDDPTKPLVEEDPGLLAEQTSKRKPKANDTPQTPETPQTPQTPKVKEKPKPKPKSKSKIIAKLDKTKLSKGQTIKIEKLYFEIDSYDLKEENIPVLNEIFFFLFNNRSVVIEIGGHTSNKCATSYCNQLSEMRAKSVRDFLIEKGVDKSRVFYKGYGKTKPISANTTKAGRNKNQRVEIKILDV